MTSVPDLTIFSNGTGVQSCTIGLLIADGTLPVPDVALFSDTRWEPRAVYRQLGRLETVLQTAGVTTYRVGRGDIRADHLDKVSPFSSMPLFVRGKDGRASISRRLCTHDYKLTPIREKTRELLGAPKPARVKKGRYAETWVGFSVDEIGRVNSNRSPSYARLTYPLLDLGWTRQDCVRYLRASGWGDVVKSSCLGCPFTNDAEWRRMRDTCDCDHHASAHGLPSEHRPDAVIASACTDCACTTFYASEWWDAVTFDRSIRNAPKGTRSQMRSEQFLHRSLLPLDQAPIDTVRSREWKGRQVDLLDVILDDQISGGCSPYGCPSGSAA